MLFKFLVWHWIGQRICIWAPIQEVIFFLPFFLLSSLKKAVKVWSLNWLGTTHCLPDCWRWSFWSAIEWFWHSPGKGEKGTWWPVCKMERSLEHETLHSNLELQRHWKISVEQLCLLPGDFHSCCTGACILLNSSTFKHCSNLHASK